MEEEQEYEQHKQKGGRVEEEEGIKNRNRRVYRRERGGIKEANKWIT